MLSNHSLIGHCMEFLLQGRSGVGVIGREMNAKAAIARSAELRPDVVIVDSDAAAVLRVLQAGPGPKVVVLSRQNNTIAIYHGEQRTVSDTSDLLAVIETE